MSLRLHRDEAPGLHRIEDGYTNWYLIQDDTRLTVVDTGHPASWRSLHQALNALGRSPGDIEAVVLTHAHFDHMGFAQRARLDLGVDLWAHELEVAVVAHPWRFDHERSRALYARYPRFLVIFTSMAANGALGVRGATDVLTYTSGAELDVPGRPRVVFTPGHTHGHCSLHLPDRGAVIAGDAFVTLNPYTGGRGPQIVAGAATADSPRALASLDALAGLDADTALTGHGEAWRGNLGEAVAQAQAAGPS